MRHLAIVALLSLVFGCISEPAYQRETWYGTTHGLTNTTAREGAQPANTTPPANVTAPAAPASSAQPAQTPPTQEPQVNATLGAAEPPVNANSTKIILNESESYVNLTAEFTESSLVFGDGRYELVLEDLAIGTSTEADCGLFTMSYYSNRSEISRAIICPEHERLWRAPDGRQFRIKVLNTATGYAKNARWASVIVYG